MKKIIFLLPFLALMACNDTKKTSEDDKQNMLDSVRSANYADEVRQRTIDSMNTINTNTPIPFNDNTQNNNVGVSHPKHTGGTNSHPTNTTTGNQQTANSPTGTTEGNTASAPADKKKKMSNRTKDAIIGAGAGVVTGVITGAATSKDKKKGAIIGGIIGGAVGSGVGYGVGAKKDDKNKKDTIK